MQRRWMLSAVFVTFCLLGSIPLQSQTDTTTSTSLHKAALMQSLFRLNGGQGITDVLMTAAVKRIAGTRTETLNLVLKAKGTDLAKVDYGAVSTELRTETYVNSGGIPACEWVDAAGTPHLSSAENCIVPVWWLPQLSPLAWVAEGAAVPVYVGRENYLGSTVDHYAIKKSFARPTPSVSANAARISLLATVDIYLDSNTGIPVALGYPIHPDSDGLTDLRVDVRFSDYRSVGGVLVPYRITRLVNGGVVLDITLASVAFNSGLSDSEFGLH